MSSPGIFQSFSKYAGVSAISFVVNLGLTITLHEVVGFTEEVSYALSLAVVFLMNFTLMRYWVYAHTRHDSDAGRQFLLTALSSITFRFLEYGAFLVLHTWLGLYYLLAILIIMAVSNFSKFFFYHSVVFARRSSK